MDESSERAVQEPSQGNAPTPKRRRRFRWLRKALLGLVVLFALIQLVPYGHTWTNPPVTKAAQWPDAQSAALAKSACNDCHSNLTNYWWGTKIAPASWLAENDVNGGRKRLNFSEWDKPQPDAGDVIEAIQGGEMPPLKYTLIHPSARLSSAEKDQLVAAVRAMYSQNPPAGTRHGDDDN